jgi:hypothetical protein
MYIGQVYNKRNVIGHASEAGSKRQAPKIKIFSLDSFAKQNVRKVSPASCDD